MDKIILHYNNENNIENNIKQNKTSNVNNNENDNESMTMTIIIKNWMNYILNV